MRTLIGTAVLVLLGTIKVVADVAGWPAASAVAAVSGAAPAMKVFTAHQDYETFSSTFEIRVTFADGQIDSMTLEPANYRGLRGPYNRRNVYGAAIAYGPVLVASPHTEPMWRSVSQYAFCEPGHVLAELGLVSRGTVQRAEIIYQPWQQEDVKHGFADYLEVTCEKA